VLWGFRHVLDLLASYYITHKHLLLHRDADFDVMETLSFKL
jgi:hypothetical protein